MSELLAGLLGAVVCLAGVYVWWSRRRFNALRTILREVLERCGTLERDQEGSSRELARHAERLHAAEHRINFLSQGREIPEPPDGRQLMEMVAPKTAWQHLSEKVDDL